MLAARDSTAQAGGTARAKALRQEKARSVEGLQSGPGTLGIVRRGDETNGKQEPSSGQGVQNAIVSSLVLKAHPWEVGTTSSASPVMKMRLREGT